LSKGGATIVSVGFRLQRTRPSRTAGGRQSYGFNPPLNDLGEIAHIESLAGTWAFHVMNGLTLSDSRRSFHRKTSCKQKAAGIRALRLARALKIDCYEIAPVSRAKATFRDR
jgi:hypothetical protein